VNAAERAEQIRRGLADAWGEMGAAWGVTPAIARVQAYLMARQVPLTEREVREALGLNEGDQVVFRVQGRRAMLARTSNLLDLAGAVPVPAEKRGTQWQEVRRRTRAARAKTRA